MHRRQERPRDFDRDYNLFSEDEEEEGPEQAPLKHDKKMQHARERREPPQHGKPPKSKKPKKDKKKGKKSKKDKPVHHEPFGNMEDHFSFDLGGKR